MNKINCSNGMLSINGMMIEPNMGIDLFKKYEEDDKVHINDRGNGRVIIRVIDSVESNGISARVKIEINSKISSFRIIILPETLSGNTLQDSIKWLAGMMDDYNNKGEEAIALSFSWGRITVQYIPDPHYGIVDGNIIIDYKR